ncbi:hypothetical protein NOF04DRAFT_17923 [Fusarium oxysporum II5]|nr:uncharacterized protein FOIG_15440 [Fusarium odoratissimum NRRL 54006]EXL91402.1 hypothetical protein FOIG_15440 [Fusarium odoratissimum NRRL 54006]KAK2130572.1 hypothetical protein NOF04DRAFT_17923 [Fusarium oxysporum II5]
MKFLSQKDSNGKTAVDLYREKQQAWCQAQAAWDKAQIQAQEDAEKKYPPTPGDDFLAKQKQYIADWTLMNYMTFRTETQGAWMDWVVNGQKYNVDFNFGVVDVDSIMSQIEDSKESLRNSTLPDERGASDVYGRKAEGWYSRNGTYTLGELDSEIARLNTLATSYTAAQELIKDHKYPVDTSTTPPAIKAPTVAKVPEADAALATSLSTLYTAEGSSGGVQPPPEPTAQTVTDTSSTGLTYDMASCDVSVSFSALVVDIDRPWLQAEIFSDADLDIAEDVLLSPGASRLKVAIAKQEAQLNPEFPAYPTSFILAADTSIDFSGSTRHIQEYFNSKTTSSDKSVGWGPFSTDVSSHHSSSHRHVQCHTTATGCKLSFGAPQIIAWVSEILPELPWAKNLNPLWQGADAGVSG